MADFSYSLQDVAECLGRLSTIATTRGVAFPDGAVVLTPEDVQARWQVVASAPQGDHAALEQLRVILNYVEAVIISCGAPDAFDVYEVTFEALTKIGFTQQSLPARELLLRLLEEVHEVYDVLLSCVETYEWVQPGATGSLRLWMLQVVFVCFGSTLITGRDLMELTDNDVSGAVSLIAFLLRCEQAPFEMQSAAGRCLVELTTADAVFLVKHEEDLQDMQIAKLTAMLNRHVNGLIKGLIQFDVVEAFGRCICQHQMSHTRTDMVVKHFLTMIHNCLLYCSENQKKLRQHLATQSTIVQDIMIPYVHNILPALYDQPTLCGPNMIEWQNLKATLQTFVVVTFNINVFRPQLRDADMLPKICQVPNILSNITMLELLIKVSINVDFTKGPFADMILGSLTGAFNALPAESQARLQRRLTSEKSMRLPFVRSGLAAVEQLAFALTPPSGEEVADPQAVAGRKQARKNKWRNAKNKSRKRKGVFGMHRAHNRKDEGGQHAPEEDDEEEEDDSSEDDMPPLIPAEGTWDTYLGASDETGVPDQAKCQLGGTFLHDPVASPEGHVFERAAIEDWHATHGSNPFTGQPMAMADLRDATELTPALQGFQMQTIAAGHLAPSAFDEPPQGVAPPAQAASGGGPSLLGDLPALGNQVQESQKKAKGKIRIESRSVVDCPDDMRCAVDGKVMINPVRSPYGHCFEKKTLERWIQNCGSVCPVSAQPLRLDECQPDAEMKKRIVKFLKGQ